MSIQADVQKLDMPAYIDLFKIEYRGLNNIYITPFSDGTSKIVYGGIEYEAIPIDLDGIETTSTGPSPQPTITISNVNSQFTPLLIQNDNLLGATVTWIRTFVKHLDGGTDPNTSIYIGKEIYKIENKESHDDQIISFQLNTPIAFDNKKIPARTAIRSCPHRYWSYVDGVRTAGTCPYVDNRYFDIFDNPTTVDKDQCGKRISSCKARFEPLGLALPHLGFPALRRS